MSHRCRAAVLVLACILLARGTRAQQVEALTSWRYCKDIQAAGAGGRLLYVVLDLQTLDKARQDHADLRLYNGAGKEIPYALRIRKDEHTSATFDASEYNRGRRGDVVEVSYDLGRYGEEHNELGVDTAGQNFRRRVEVEGSNDSSRWSAVVSGALIFRFSTSGGSVDEGTVKYPVSRYRYLRVSVHPDPQVDSSAPIIESITIRRTIRVQGEVQQFPGVLQGREPTREDARPASAYRIDLRGRVPLQALSVTVAQAPFSRPYRLEVVDEDPANPRHLTSGRLVRREGNQTGELRITFAEQFARRLKLTVTDDRNPPLSISNISAHSVARQVIFDVDPAGAGPFKLYYGNRKAAAPRYDFAASLPRVLPQKPLRLPLGAQQDNPAYRPEPKPFSERSPWVIYLVLGLASAILFVILRNLAKTMTVNRLKRGGGPE